MSTFITDTFTDTDGTLLSAHTPDAGGAWAGYTSTPVIQSNAAASTAFTVSRAWNDQPTTSDDYEVVADVRLVSPASGNAAGVRARDIGEFAAYEAIYDFLSTTWNLNYGFSNLGSFSDPTFLDGVTRSVTLRVQGTTITVLVDGVSVISLTDSSGTTGFAGVVSAGGTATGAVVDNFICQDVSGGGSPGVHVLTGRGSITIDSLTIWLSTALGTRAGNVTAGNAEPPNWYHAGMLSWGTVAHGAMDAYPVTRDLDLVQIPAGMDTLWYSFSGVDMATVTELTAP